jgi:hypothetical protein
VAVIGDTIRNSRLTALMALMLRLIQMVQFDPDANRS